MKNPVTTKMESDSITHECLPTKVSVIHERSNRSSLNNVEAAPGLRLRPRTTHMPAQLCLALRPRYSTEYNFLLC